MKLFSCLASFILHDNVDIHPQLCVSVVYFSLLLKFGHTKISSSIHLVMDIWFVSRFWLLQIKLLQTLMSKSLYRHRLSFLFCTYLKVEWLGCRVDVCLMFWESIKVLSKVFYLKFPPALYESSINSWHGQS